MLSKIALPFPLTLQVLILRRIQDIIAASFSQ